MVRELRSKTLLMCLTKFKKSERCNLTGCGQSTRWKSTDLTECTVFVQLFNFINLKYSAHKIYLHFVFTSHCIHVYKSSVMELISEKLISMSATLKTSIKCMLLSTKEKLDIINQVEATQNVPCKVPSTYFTFVCPP